MRGGDGGAEADGLGGVGVGGVGGEVRAVDLFWCFDGSISQGWRDWRKGERMRWVEGRTDSMAFLTRSDVMRPLLVRFLIRPAFEEPDDSQAMASLSTVGLGKRGRVR